IGFLPIQSRFCLLMMGHVMLRGTHHLEHGQATRSDKPDHKQCCQHEKNDIEHGCIVPLDALGNGDNVPILWNNPKRLKQELDNVSCCCHRDVKGHQNIAHHFPTVVFAINVQNGKNNQIGKDEADDTTKANSASP